MKHVSTLVMGRLLTALLSFLLLAGPARAQAPAWQMARATSQFGSRFSQVSATTTDASGNVYLVGTFAGTATFGSTTLTSAAGTLFIAKWSLLSATYAWALQAGGSRNYEEATAVAVSGSSVYVTGSFRGASATFGATTLTNFGLGIDDIFIAKLTDAGTSAGFVWVQQAGGTNLDKATALAVSGANVYVAGQFRFAAQFGSTALTTTGAPDNAFVAKLIDAGTSGSFAWALRAGGAERATALAANGASVYMTGSFGQRTAVFGATTLTNAGLYVAKLTDAGATASFTWAQRAAGNGADQALALALAGTSLYVAGCFNGAQGRFGSTVLPNSGIINGFVAKLTDAGPTGSFVWAQQMGGADIDSVTAVTVQGTSVYVAGTFASATASFGSTSLTKMGGPSGLGDIFVAKLADAGTTASFAWAQRAGGIDNDYATAVAVNGATIYVAGTVRPAASFGTETIASPTGNQVGFLASLTDPTLLATTTAQGTLPFTLAPNPARAATTVQLPAQPGTGTATATLTLRDALGRALRTETINLPAAGLRHELDLTGLPAGIYAVQVRAGAATATRRLVVE